MIVPYIRNYDTKRILSDATLIWNDDWAVPTAYILTNLQFGFSFNIPKFDDVFQENV